MEGKIPPWKDLEDVQMWQLGTRFSGGLESSGFTVGLNVFQPKQFHDSMILFVCRADVHVGNREKKGLLGRGKKWPQNAPVWLWRKVK